mmetsp:Transcript_4885/g.6707  ORF Transcript_4885/g.6707 Transcript_4885/m.6707 type:complete len:124 (+) Transcript_4885:35-406(+)
MSETPLQRQLRIKLGVCKRLQREMRAYEEEVKVNEARVQKMRDDGKDPYDIKKQEEVLGESYMMIPDTRKRLEESYEDLSALLEGSQHDPEIQDTENLQEAQKLLSEANASNDEQMEEKKQET